MMGLCKHYRVKLIKSNIVFKCFPLVLNSIHPYLINYHVLNNDNFIIKVINKSYWAPGIIRECFFKCYVN